MPCRLQLACFFQFDILHIQKCRNTVLFWKLNICGFAAIYFHELTEIFINLMPVKYMEGDIPYTVNTLRPRQNGHHFADDTFKRIFLNENVAILIKISLKFVHKGQINNIPALVLIMAWRRPGDKPLSEPMVVRLPTHICVTRPQWVNHIFVSL